MEARTSSEPFAVRDMLWDRPDIEVTRRNVEKRGLALLLTECGDLEMSIRHSMDLAGFDVSATADIDRLLSVVATRRPDLVFLDHRLTRGHDDLDRRLDRARTTHTLPVLPIRSSMCQVAGQPSLGTCSGKVEILLKAQALLRRERPTALRGHRHHGRFVLDESRFKLFLANQSADLSKSELCLLGPFFDVAKGILDRETIEQLALDPSHRTSNRRAVDFHISRMRRRIRTQLNIDPIRSIRGKGYALCFD